MNLRSQKLQAIEAAHRQELQQLIMLGFFFFLFVLGLILKLDVFLYYSEPEV